MTSRKHKKTRSLGRALGLALWLTSAPLPTFGQALSTGSGVGTGTGVSGGAAANSTGTGLESGLGGRTLGSGSQSGSAGTLGSPSLNGVGPAGNDRSNLRGTGGNNSDASGVPLGPGVNADLPGDSMSLGSLLTSPTGNAPSRISDSQLNYARSIPAVGDRSLALSRVAGTAIFTGQFDVAELALDEASKSAAAMEPGLVRDQRLVSIIGARMNLAEAYLRGGRGSATPGDAERSPDPLPGTDTRGMIRRSMDGWHKAAELGRLIVNPTYRNESLYRIVDSMSYGSQTIVNYFSPDPQSGKRTDGLNDSYSGLPDLLLQQAASLAALIDRPIWHDRALAQVASAASDSAQFARALAVSRMIPHPEVRADALTKLASVEARRGTPEGATRAYSEAAQAVAAMPIDDPRSVLLGVLIDSLVSAGRFDDARIASQIYTEPARRMIALGAIAESQGRRGLGASAIAWIDREVPPESRSQLYRRVNNGIVSGIEQNRNRDVSATESTGR